MTFKTIPLRLDFIRTIPKTGSWVCLVGNPYAQRKNGLPAFTSQIGLRRQDIIWAYEELIPGSILKILNKYIKISIGIDIINSNKTRKLKKDYKLTEQDKIHIINYYNSILNHNRTSSIFTVKTGHSETVRYYNHEVKIYTKEKLKKLREAYIIKHWTIGDIESTNISPILDDTLKDLIGSLQLDGMSKIEAIDYIIKNMIDNTNKQNVLLNCQYNAIIESIPNYWYRLRNEYWELFN